MTYRSKYVDKVNSRNSRRSFLKSLAAAPVAASAVVPVVTKSFESESEIQEPESRQGAVWSSHVFKASRGEFEPLRVYNGTPCTAVSLYTCGPFTEWPRYTEWPHKETK